MSLNFEFNDIFLYPVKIKLSKKEGIVYERKNVSYTSFR